MKKYLLIKKEGGLFLLACCCIYQCCLQLQVCAENSSYITHDLRRTSYNEYSSLLKHELQALSPVRSLLECTILCAHNSSCHAVFYRKSQRNCTLVTSDSHFPQAIDQEFYSDWYFYIHGKRDAIVSCSYTYLSTLGKCVSFHYRNEDKKKFLDAIADCQSRGGEIVDFSDSSEFLAFRDVIRFNSTFETRKWYIGLMWTSSDPIWRYSNTGVIVSENDTIWKSEEPNYAEGVSAFCGNMEQQFDFLVDDTPCSRKRNYACQYFN